MAWQKAPIQALTMESEHNVKIERGSTSPKIAVLKITKTP